MRIRITNKKASFNINDGSCLEDSLKFIREGLSDAGVNSKLAIKAEMLSEEMLTAMMQHASGEAFNVQIKRMLGDAVINIGMKGEEFDIYAGSGDLEDSEDDEKQEIIRSILLRAYGENLKYVYKRGTNRVTIKAEEAPRSMLKSTLIAVVLALLLGFLMKTAMPETMANGLIDYLISPFRTMFMNALKMVIGPVVFFSIVSCLSQFKDISELGKIGAKIMATYMFTTLMAVIIATSVFFFFTPGTEGAALTGTMETQAVDVDTNVDTSLLHTIINIVPSNFVNPFLENNTLQIIFLALICGIAIGMIGDYSKVLREWFEACNSLFLTITTIIARLIPFAVFCSVTIMFHQMGGRSLLSLVTVYLVHGVAILLMLVLYGLLVMIAGRLNPLKFYSKIKESMVTSLMLLSSSAAMPTNMNTCTQKLGISPKVANFSIPLGATINMDGTCVFLTIFGFYLARLYGVEVSVSTILSLAITIILLSLGAPGVPGSGIVCLGIVITQLGVPIEGLGLVIAINPFVDMLDTMSNITGDIAAATVTARSEKLLDAEVFNS